MSGRTLGGRVWVAKDRWMCVVRVEAVFGIRQYSFKSKRCDWEEALVWGC
jgi:hypothetical protein